MNGCKGIVLSIKISQAEKDKRLYVFTYMWNLKIKRTYITKQRTQRHREQINGYQWEEDWGKRE